MDDLSGPAFRNYIWSKNGIAEKLRVLNSCKYDQDLKLILFHFYVKPIPYLQHALKEVERYIGKEKSIGIPIIITDENFFNKSEKAKYEFLKQSILIKLDLLSGVVSRRKLDTDMESLKYDFSQLWIQDINI